MNRRTETHRKFRRLSSGGPQRAKSGDESADGRLDSEYAFARWYIDSAEPSMSGVNPRVEERSDPGAAHAFVSLPLLHLTEANSEPLHQPPAPVAPPAPASRAAAQPTHRHQPIAEPPATKSNRSRLAQTEVVIRPPKSSDRSQVVASPGPERESAELIIHAEQAPSTPPATARETEHAAHVAPRETHAAGGHGGEGVTTAVNDGFAGRRFRLDHSDWLPAAPHSERVNQLGRAVDKELRAQATSASEPAAPPARESSRPRGTTAEVISKVAGSEATESTDRDAQRVRTALIAAAIVAAQAKEKEKAGNMAVEARELGPAPIAELPSTSTSIEEVIGPKSEIDTESVAGNRDRYGPLGRSMTFAGQNSRANSCSVKRGIRAVA
ncbi:MAG: hypothetical protein R3B96_05985 [Pirellulaceae bacterium]